MDVEENRMWHVYKRALECYSGTLMILNKDAEIIFANSKAVEILEISREKLVGSNMYELVKQGILSQSAEIHTLETGQEANAYCTNRSGKGCFTYAEPDFDAKGNVEYVYSYGQFEESMLDYLDWVKSENRKMLTFMRSFTETYNGDFEIICASKAMKNVLDMVCRIAPTTATILLNGESGCGKEVIARYIHEHSNRKENIFLPVNCAAILKEIAESELFG